MTNELREMVAKAMYESQAAKNMNTTLPWDFSMHQELWKEHADAAIAVMFADMMERVTDEVCAGPFGQSDLWDMTATTGKREADNRTALTEFKGAVKGVLQAILSAHQEQSK